VFREYGVNIGQGLINGIDAMHGKVASSVTGLTAIPQMPAFGAGSYSAALMPASPSPVNLSGRVTLSVGGRDFDAYISQTADSRIQSADHSSQYRRTGR
jgi:hypothetical protein